MGHFTYVDDIDRVNLKQGDVLKKTESLLNTIERVHPYFRASTYTHFLVLTQSCDLVLRDSKCKSRYITIAPIRPLEAAVKRKAEEVANSVLEKSSKSIISDKTYSKLTEFLTSLLNNNIPEYFYLHPEPAFDLIEPSVAFLRVSIALKSDLHYDTCIASKIMELEDSFKAKLGWLVGNLYSRVGTVDWVPKALEQIAFRQHVKNQLESHFTVVHEITEIEREILKSHNEVQLKSLPIEDLIMLVKGVKRQSMKDKVLIRIEEILCNSKAFENEEEIASIIKRMRNDTTLASILKTR